MTQNTKYHAEIRQWNTQQLINVLELNGLSDCSEAIQNLEIDGEAFLNLTEGQLAFWRKYLNNVQVKRLWSIIQLARERPKDFVGEIKNTSNPHQEMQSIRSPIAHSLEKSGVMPGNSIKQNNLLKYENNETIMQIQGKLAYKKLPPKPVLTIPQQPPQPPQQQQQQQQQLEEYLPMKATETEKQIFNNKYLQKPMPHVEISQKPEIAKTKFEETRSNSFLHSNVRVLPPITNEVTNMLTPSPNEAINRLRRVPSPSTYLRPLPPVPPKEQNPFPLPPNVVPIIPNLKFGVNDEDYPLYDDVVSEHYKTKSWYSNIDRKQANELLIGKPNGTFIARPSKQENYECSLSIVYNYRIYNLGVAKQNHKFVIGNQEFNSVNEIIEFFMENEMVLNGVNNEDIVVTLRPI